MGEAADLATSRSSKPRWQGRHPGILRRFADDWIRPRWLAGFYAGAMIMWGAAGLLAGAGVVFLLALGLVALQLAWQIRTLDMDDAGNCLARFKSNQVVGWVLLGGVVTDMALAAMLQTAPAGAT